MIDLVIGMFEKTGAIAGDLHQGARHRSGLRDLPCQALAGGVGLMVLVVGIHSFTAEMLVRMLTMGRWFFQTKTSPDFDNGGHPVYPVRYALARLVLGPP